MHIKLRLEKRKGQNFIIIIIIIIIIVIVGRSQWLRGLRRRSTAARLLRLWIRIPTGAWVFVVCVVSYRSLRRADHSSRGVLLTVARRCV
jgi:hypothetical protein